MYSAPASRAAVRSDAVRRMSSLASASSRAGCSRERTTGGPPSGESFDEKCRETENVEQGGDATIAAYSPAAQR
eukprot:2294870-Pleurochrysis_carterae.AAC.1